MSASDDTLEDLDTPSFLNDGGWSGSLFIGAGELSGCMVLRSTQPSSVASSDRYRDRSQDSEGAARAAKVTRLYVVANDLRSLVTLTFNSLPEPKRAAHEVKLLMRRCSHARGRFPNLWTLERGSLRGRIHCHLLLPASLGPLADEMWSHGKVDVQTMPGGFGALREAAAYVSKAFDCPVLDPQRYRVAKGFQPEAIPIAAASAELLVQEADARMGTYGQIGHRSSLIVSAQWES